MDVDVYLDLNLDLNMVATFDGDPSSTWVDQVQVQVHVKVHDHVDVKVNDYVSPGAALFPFAIPAGQV
jgi:hypothetical protein